MALYWCNNLCWFIPKVCDVKLMYLDYYISIGVAMTMALLYHHLEHVQLQYDKIVFYYIVIGLHS